MILVAVTACDGNYTGTSGIHWFMSLRPLRSDGDERSPADPMLLIKTPYIKVMAMVPTAIVWASVVTILMLRYAQVFFWS